MMPLLRTSENPDEIFLENFLLFFSLVQYDKVEIWAKKSREYGVHIIDSDTETEEGYRLALNMTAKIPLRGMVSVKFMIILVKPIKPRPLFVKRLNMILNFPMLGLIWHAF